MPFTNDLIRSRMAAHGFRREVDKAGDCYTLQVPQHGSVSITVADLDGLNMPTSFNEPVIVMLQCKNGLEVHFDVGPLRNLIGQPHAEQHAIKVYAQLLGQLCMVSTPDGGYHDGTAPNRPLRWEVTPAAGATPPEPQPVEGCVKCDNEGAGHDGGHVMEGQE